MTAQNKFTTCTFVLEKCDFSNPQLAPTCIQNWCLGEPYGFGSCTTDFTGTPANCCSQSDVASCMASFQSSQGYTFSGSTTSSTDQCLVLQSYVNACASANPGFSSFLLQKQAECLCYDSSGNFSPTRWDDAASSCVATGKTAHPTIYSELMANNGAAIGLCTKVAVPETSGAAASSTPETAAVSSNVAAQTSMAAATSARVTGVPATSEAATSAAATGQTTSTTGSVASSVAAAGTSVAASAGTTKPSGGNGGMSNLQMKWMVAGLGFLIPGLVLGVW